MNKAKSATKSVMLQELSSETSLTKKQIGSVFEALTRFIHDQLGKKGPGVVMLPGLLKIKRVEKPATPARPGRNPLTGEAIMISAKPKRTVVKSLCLKALKDTVK